jgi:hypothetical protein
MKENELFYFYFFYYPRDAAWFVENKGIRKKREDFDALNEVIRRGLFYVLQGLGVFSNFVCLPIIICSLSFFHRNAADEGEFHFLFFIFLLIAFFEGWKFHLSFFFLS